MVGKTPAPDNPDLAVAVEDSEIRQGRVQCTRDGRIQGAPRLGAAQCYSRAFFVLLPARMQGVLRKRSAIVGKTESKEGFVVRFILAGCLVASLHMTVAVAQPSSSMRVTDLKTEHLSEPLGLETPHPRLRWLLNSAERGQSQTAYQILVATSLEKLQTDTGDKWDSSRVMSDNSVEIPYVGRELTSGERAYWKVRVWDRNGRPTAYSAPSFFEMGLLSASDWQGKWIAASNSISSPLLRREFSIDAPVRGARVYVSGLGYYELSLNGKKVGDHVLDPASTYYHNDQPFKLGSRVLYATYDVTDALRHGANALGIVLGHGWYSADKDSSLRVPYGDRPRLMFQMNIEFTDGRKLSVVSDATWKVASGPITYNDLAHGETYDARLEQSGWDSPGFNGSSWENASLVPPPSGALIAQLLPPSEVIETIPVTKVLTPKEPETFDNTYVYDFGQNFSGWVRIAVSGPRGTKVVLRYGSRIYPEDNTLDTRSNEPPGGEARQTDTYILKGEGTELWEPRFTLHGFRYVEVRGATDTPVVQKIEGRFVRSAVESTGSFASSNELLNRIHHNIQWAFMSSFQGIPQDAADRDERVGCTGDSGFVAEDFIYNYDIIGFWEKWLDDLEDGQKEDGSLPYDAPDHWRFGNRVWPTWQSTYPLLIWYLYQYYGDTRVLETHYDSLKKLIDFLGVSAKSHIISTGLGDHMEPQENGFSSFMAVHTPAALTATAYYYYEVVLLERMAEVLGRSSDAKRYRRSAQDIKQAFNRRFFDAGTSQYATGSQTSNALAVYLDLVPPEKIPAVMKNLLDDIKDHDYHVSTGIIGSNAVVQTLPEHGAAELMYRLATQTTYPSLGHQVMMGTTTLCETYECGPWLSQNMKMFGSLDKFFYRNLAGIYPGSPGFRRVLIKPQPVGDLRTVSAFERTVRGTVSVDWIKGSGYWANGNFGSRSFVLNVSIPAGMTADIVIPTLGWMNVHITEGGATVWKDNVYVPDTPGLTGAEAGADSVLIHAGSGSYHFVLNGAAF